MSTSSIEALASAWSQIAEEALQEADDPNARSYRHEEVMRAMQAHIDRARDQPC